jgi:uncharacterized membrane protein
MIFAGVGHLTFARYEFQAQVPFWIPVDPDLVVLGSGVIEIVLGIALFTRGRWLQIAGLCLAVFFVLIFPGNINQYIQGIDAFGLDSDQARLTRLFFQPLLVLWALWSTRALQMFKR